MSHSICRRQFLAAGLAAAGAVAVGRPSFGESPRAAYYPKVKAGAPAPTSPVAIQRATSYDPAVLREKLDKAFDLIGGLKRLVSNKTVSIKINVTGGPGKLGGLPGYQTYQSNPNMLAALCAALDAAGAKRMTVLESQYSSKSPEEVLTDGGWDMSARSSRRAATASPSRTLATAANGSSTAA